MKETNDEELRREVAALDQLRQQLAALPDPHPSRGSDDRFAKMLAGHDRKILHLRPAALMSIAASLLLLVFAMGWYFGNSDHELEGELAATRSLMLELMDNQSSNARMRAATVSLDIAVADPEVIANLGKMLRTDENTNVRLAALDALGRFAATSQARQEMLDAMGGDPPPAVRVQLLETLVNLNEKRVLPYLEELKRNDSLPQRLRDAAELGTFKLI